MHLDRRLIEAFLIALGLILAVGRSHGEPTARAQSADRQEQEEQLPSDYVFRDRVSVDLVTLVIRVIDGGGHPILGLTPRDFEVRHRRQELPVVAVEWVARGAESSPAPVDAGDEASARPPPFPQRLVVFWIQTDLHAVRIKGLLRIQPFVRRILDSLPPEDLVAVLSFDSHLKLRQDFTRHREAPARAIEDAVRFGKSPLLRRSGYPSLARHFDFRAAQAAAKPETALRVTAEALLSLPGEKLLVYLGWGLGRYGSGGFSMTGEYLEARRTLLASRTSVFVLDITDADFHTLELGLREVAADTGGTYEKTNRYTEQAVNKLLRAISGYYVLTLDRSGIVGPLDGLKIRAPGRNARILARAR